MLFGYARVSTDAQSTAAQTHALTEAGCSRTFTETASGGRWLRPEMQRMLDQLRAGDVVVVWKLDRLTRSLSDLLLIIERIHLAGAGFRSLTEQLDTTSAAGRMMMHMIGAFAEFERGLIRERTRAGLAEAKRRGRKLGRPSALSANQKETALRLINQQHESPANVARLLKVSRTTISRLMAKEAVTNTASLSRNSQQLDLEDAIGRSD